MRKKLCLILLFTFAIALCLFSACHTHEHEVAKWTVMKQATCDEDGLYEGFCECGKRLTQVMPKDHWCTNVVKQLSATCTESGLQTLRCKCGKESATTFIPPLGHNIIEHVAKAPTCTEVGWEPYKTCSRCSYITYKEIPITHKLNGTICTVCDVDYVSTGLIFELNDDGQSYTVVGIDGVDAQIVVPATYNDKPVVAISERAFYDCRYITYVHLPDSITSIGDRAFTGCDKLKSIIIPQGVTTIGAHTFSRCLKLESITIPAGITSINDYTFSSCHKLKAVTFAGNQVKSIGDSAFAHCDSLENILLPNSLESIADSAFAECHVLKTINIPQSVTSIGNSVFSDCMAMTDIVVDTNNANYKSIDGNLYSKDGTVLICYSAGKTATSFDIPQSVTTIAERAFASSQLKNITVGGNVTKVEGYAFVASIQLLHVTFTAPLETLETSVFYNCQNLESVTLPSSLKTIGDYIFYNCYKLKSVNYCGSEEQWNLIKKTKNWDYTIAKFALNFNYNEK